MGERYFVAKTPGGVCVVNYEPGEESYIGGPFLTWDGAYAFVGAHRRKRMSTAFVVAGVAVAVLVVAASLVSVLLS